MGLWATFMEAIPAYTGLTPVTFFTLVAVLVAVYHLVSGMFAAPEPPRGRDFVPMEPIPEPVQLGEVTEEELKSYDGTDPKKPLLMAIKGQIYDVSQSRMFYGPGGPYALFAGKDASRALAKMSFEEKDLTGDLEGLGPFELDALQDWEYKFMGKYVKVGQIKKPAVKEVEVSGSGNAPDADIKKPAVKEVEVSGSGNAPDADHSTREVQVNEESSVDVTEAVNIAKEVAEGTTNDETQVANGTLDGEEAAKPKENGVEPKEDIDGTKDPAEISEALEDALVEKKNVERVHEANHAVPVA